MHLQLLDKYARLLTTDTRACADLFAHDAEYRTPLGSHRLCFVGRDDIRRFIAHVPRQIAFRAARADPDGTGWRGELVLSASDLVPRSQRVSFRVEDGLFRRFEVV